MTIFIGGITDTFNEFINEQDVEPFEVCKQISYGFNVYLGRKIWSGTQVVKGPDWKSGRGESLRGFKSHPFRQESWLNWYSTRLESGHVA